MGDKAGQRHQSGTYEKGSRKGRGDIVDLSGLGVTFDAVIGQRLTVECVGRRHYVAVQRQQGTCVPPSVPGIGSMVASSGRSSAAHAPK